MQSQAMEIISAGSRHSEQNVVFLKLVSVSEYNAKRLFISGETLFISNKENPISFMDNCESIHISGGKTWKAALDRCKSINRGKQWFFVLERSEE